MLLQYVPVVLQVSCLVTVRTCRATMCRCLWLQYVPAELQGVQSLLQRNESFLQQQQQQPGPGGGYMKRHSRASDTSSAYSGRATLHPRTLHHIHHTQHRHHLMATLLSRASGTFWAALKDRSFPLLATLCTATTAPLLVYHCSFQTSMCGTPHPLPHLMPTHFCFQLVHLYCALISFSAPD